MKAIIECKMNNYTSMTNEIIESKTQVITNTEEFVPRFEPPLYVPAFTTMKDSLSSKGSLTKGPYTTPPTQPSTKEVAQSQLRLQSTW